MDKSEIFATVRRARQLVNEHPQKPISPETAEEYKKEFYRLERKAKDEKDYFSSLADAFLDAIQATQRKNTYYKKVAAVRWVMGWLIPKLLKKQDQHQRDGDTKALGTVVNHMTFWLGIAASLDESKGRCPVSSVQPRHSKRQDLCGLPCGWREQMAVQLARKPSIYYLSFLVTAIFGCRPAELEKGVRLCRKDGVLALAVESVKVSESKGQPIRVIGYRLDDSSHPLVLELAQQLEEGAHEIVRIDNSKNWCNCMCRTGKTLWPRKKARISPYMLRHAFASDLKAELADADDVSRALGHCVSATRSYYGQAQISRGRKLSPAAISAPREIKQTHSPHPRNNKKQNSS